MRTEMKRKSPVRRSPIAKVASITGASRVIGAAGPTPACIGSTMSILFRLLRDEERSERFRFSRGCLFLARLRLAAGLPNINFLNVSNIEQQLWHPGDHAGSVTASSSASTSD
jgi:hypothetical protein